jgi:hypothetical protein
MRMRCSTVLLVALSAFAVGTGCFPAALAAEELRQSTPSPADGEGGRHDMLLLLPHGPLHLRLQLSDRGKSLQTQREEYLVRLAAALDTDGDGKISRAETAKHPLFVTGRRFDGNAFVASLRGEKFYSDADLRVAVDRAAGQLMAFRQNSAMADQDMRVFRALDEDNSGLVDRAEIRTAASRAACR